MPIRIQNPGNNINQADRVPQVGTSYFQKHMAHVIYPIFLNYITQLKLSYLSAKYAGFGNH